MGSWIAIVAWFMVTVLIFYIKHSGRTFKTQNHQVNLRYIGKIFILWSIAFLIKSILSIFILNKTFDSDTQITNMTKLILIVLTQLLTDIGPCIAVLELKFIEIFKTIKHQRKLVGDDDDSNTYNNNMETDIHLLDRQSESSLKLLPADTFDAAEDKYNQILRISQQVNSY